MRYILGLIFFLLTSQAQADWAAFAHVTPTTQERFKFDVSVIPVSGQKNKFKIRFDAVEYAHKLAWLIISSEALSKKGQVLRNYIWNSAKAEKEILVKSKLMPVGRGGFLSKGTETKYYEIELDSVIMKRAYVYIDFPSRTLDGGYYYSIDLASYLDKSVNKN